MERTPDRSMSLFTALATATVTAVALDYIAHAEWGLTLVLIRRDALVVAGVLTLVTILRAVIERKRNRNL